MATHREKTAVSNCKNCRNWCASKKIRKYRNVFDCYWVIGSINPSLFEARNRRGYRFTLPFDPHSAEDFDCDENFLTQYKYAITDLPEGVEVEKIDGQYYFKTKEGFHCEYHESL